MRKYSWGKRPAILLAVVCPCIYCLGSRDTASRPERRATSLSTSASLRPHADAAAKHAPAAAEAVACPAVIMFDGVNVDTDSTEKKAKYWGSDIGVNGFLLNNVMADWRTAVSEDEHSRQYVHLKQFQALYARYGVDHNFSKVAIYKPIEWKKSVERARVVKNFRDAAHLARFSGLRGVALDLESYVQGFWQVDPDNPGKGDILYGLGKQIGDAIEQGYPGSAVFVIREVLWWKDRAPNYALSGRFWDGLVTSSISRIYMGEELTYDSPTVPGELSRMYRENAVHNRVNPNKVEIEPGLWPLGHSYTDKTPRMSTPIFRRQLKEAFAQNTEYVWIYGFGSAWEADGFYGKGPVAADFREYVSALQQIKKECRETRKR